MRWFCVLALWFVLAVGACSRKGGEVDEVDTTKDVYTDDEAPKVQVQILNGETKEVPWAEVPEKERWFNHYNPDGSYKLHVPIVRVIISSHDKNGKPVPPEGDTR